MVCMLGIFVASIQPSRSWISGSFECLRWNACVHTLDLGLHSHPKEFWGNGVRTHVNSKGKIPHTEKNLLRGGSNPQRCIKQDSEPNTLPSSNSGPQFTVQIWFLDSLPGMQWGVTARCAVRCDYQVCSEVWLRDMQWGMTARCAVRCDCQVWGEACHASLCWLGDFFCFVWPVSSLLVCL